ncbi:hypothetical protein D9M73_121200 [compost metagenome]
MDAEQNGGEEHEAEFDRLGHPGQGRGEREAEQHAADRLAPIGRGGVVHGEAGGGQAEHHHREEPGHEASGARVAREEAAQIAGGAVPVADHEPGDVVEDMVQPRHQQQPVEQAEHEQPRRARAGGGGAERIDAIADRLEAKPDDKREREPGQPADDRHEAAAAEEGEIFGQFDRREAIVEQAADQPRQDPDRHVEPRHDLGFPCRCGEVDRRAGKACNGFGGDGQQRLARLGRHQEAGDARQTCRTIAIARKAGCDADREQQAEMVEDRLPRRADKGQAAGDEIGLAEPHQQAGDW